MPKGKRIQIGGHEIGSKIQEFSFGLGVLLGASAIGYYMVSGQFKNCLDFYGVIESKVKQLTK